MSGGMLLNVADISRFVLVDIVVNKFVIASVFRGEVTDLFNLGHFKFTETEYFVHIYVYLCNY